MKKMAKKALSVVLIMMMVLSMVSFDLPVYAGEGDTYGITGTASSSMFAMDNIVVTELADGTYMIRMHQNRTNRNVLALTDDVTKATEHEVDWYVGTGDGYTFVFHIQNLTTPVSYCMSSLDRIEAGNAFGNPQTLTLDPESLTETDANPVTASEMNVSKRISKTNSVTTTSVAVETGKVSGMYTMDNVVATKLSDGTYLVRMHQASVNRNLLALTDDKDKATSHSVDWYKGTGDGYTFVIPVASLDEPVIFCMSSESRVEAGNAFGNPMKLTFDLSTLSPSDETVLESEMNILPAVKNADYSKVEAALAKVPEDLSVYTDETAKAVTDAVSAVVYDLKDNEQERVDGFASAIEAAVSALVLKETEETPV
ncbi:MAG: hypothetical protein MJ171_07985, partial [Clostridia bacterium]|nr:hypothetical protein [Clostridia bacterium]